MSEVRDASPPPPAQTARPVATRRRTTGGGSRRRRAGRGGGVGRRATLQAPRGFGAAGRRPPGRRQRASASLVHAGDERDPGPPGLGLVAVRRRRGRRHAGLAGYSVWLSGAVAGTTLIRF